MGKKVYIETIGCQVNKADSEKILGILEAHNYSSVDTGKEADLLIINTCSIRAAAEDKAFSHLGLWGKWKRKTHPHIKIAICGCVAQQVKEKIFRRAPYVDLIFGTHNINELPLLLDRLEKETKVCSILKKDFESDNDFEVKRDKGTTAWLPIIEGCDYFCTYCVVPYTRGRQRSRNPEDIFKEAKEIVEQGYKEIILLGQTVDSYGKDFEEEGINLSYLLKEIHKLDGLERMRFMTSHPLDITDELIQTVKELPKICEYFHLPMQAGSTEVLSKMKRGYTVEEYKELIHRIRTAMPDVTITSDFIAGFPGETDEQFMETINIIDELNFDYCNTAVYSQRKQTPAAVWKEQIPISEKKQRIYKLNEHVKVAIRRSNENDVGRIFEILVEKSEENNGEILLNGRARNNKIVHFKGDVSLVGTLVNVEIIEASAWCLKGNLV